MAKKPTTKKTAAKKPAAATAPTVNAGAAIQGISKEAFDKLIKRLKHPSKQMDTIRGEIGGLIAGAVEKDHVHKGALGMVRRLMRVGEKSGVSLGEFLFHFDLMREHADLDGIAASDMLEDRKAKADAKADAKANGKDDAGAKADMKSGAVSLDAKRAEKEAAKNADTPPTEQAGALLN